MPATYSLLASNVLSSSAASVTFSAIPSSYTDLVVRLTARSSRAAASTNLGIKLNGATTNYSDTNVGKNTSNAAFSTRTIIGDLAYQYLGALPGANSTASTFGVAEYYIPNYAGSTNKPASTFSVWENNSATESQIFAIADLYSSTTAITSIEIIDALSTFAAGSSFYLYGIKNS